MNTTQGFIEDEMEQRAQCGGLKITCDLGHQGNVVTYRTYNEVLHLIGTVTVHYEESFASIVNYAGRDTGANYRYGRATQKLMKAICDELKIEFECVEPQEQSVKKEEYVPTDFGAPVKKKPEEKKPEEKKPESAPVNPFQPFAPLPTEETEMPRSYSTENLPKANPDEIEEL
jgi:hypothetical protein